MSPSTTVVDRQSDLAAVPTEFESLLEYQMIMSQLVLKEALAGIQKDLDMKQSRGAPAVVGEVSVYLARAE